MPLALGVKDPFYIAITFSSVWFIYAILLFITTFLIEGRHTNKKSDSITLFDIQEVQALYGITVKKNDQEKKEILWS